MLNAWRRITYKLYRTLKIKSLLLKHIGFFFYYTNNSRAQNYKYKPLYVITLKSSFVCFFLKKNYVKISSVIKSPAMLAFKKQIIDPAIRARTATEVMTVLFSGDNVPKLPIIIPNELKLAKPQMAYVVIAELRNCSYKKNKKLKIKYY